jgi:hypothetical protein
MSMPIILNTTIDYGYSIQVMFDSINNAGHQGILQKVYGAPSGQHPQNVMKMAQVADRLSEYLSPECLGVEWSANFCDHSRVFQALEKLGRASIMPHISNFFRLNFAGRLAFAGFDISCDLSMIYCMIGK